MPDQFPGQFHRVRPNDQLPVIGLVFARQSSRQRQFAVAGLFKADRKGFDGMGALQRHGRNHRRGIDAATQERAERDVYKRQAKPRREASYSPVCAFRTTRVTSVSYTHLDVYKRQP